MTSFPATAGRVIAVVAPACVGVLVTACSTSITSAPPAPTATATATPTTAATSAPATTGPSTAPSTAATSAAAPPGPAPCPTRYLAAKLGLAQGAAGSAYQVIDFTNISNLTCTFYGYPGVALAAGTPVTQVGLAATENPATPRQLVTLAPGAVANALLRIVDAGNFPAAKCHAVTATYLQIYPPNQTTPIYLSYRSQACAKPIHILTVNAVRPGSGG